MPNTGSSKWIAPVNGFPNQSPGTYIYRTTFDLTGLDPTTATISGLFAVDNSISTISLNGNQLFVFGGGYTGFTPFSFTSGFVSGVNFLYFDVNNDGGPTGLHVQMSGFADLLETPTAVPEPTTALLWLVGGVVCWRYRANKRVEG